MKDKAGILLVEDDVVDAMTVQRALKEIKVANPLSIACNGEEALELLRDEAKANPGLILLDLNMPKMNGLELLRILKQDPVWRRIPVVVLTTSKHDEDKVESFDLSVAGYMIKPVDYIKFVEAMRTIDLYWSLSELPSVN